MTTRLLQRLSDTLGEDATNDLLVFLEEERTLSRTEFRQIAESYFERFSTVLRQEVTRLDGGLGEVRAQVTAVQRELGQIRGENGQLRGEFGQLRAELKADLATQRADLLKWMFLFWAGTVMPLAGLMVALAKL